MRILIIGCGRVGAGLAQTMLLRGHSVVVVDKDPLAFERLGSRFKGQTVIGVGFDRNVLLNAGIERADGLAAVTASDETNVLIGRIAQQIFRVPRVIARLYDVRQAEIYRRLGLPIIAPTSWGINRIADMLLYSPLDAVYSLGAGEVELVEIQVPQTLVGRPARDLTLPGEIHVVAITRGGKTFLPTPGATLQEGDVLHLATLTTSASRLRGLLGY
jgi:trk system potassium uptake protein TrkA